VWRSIRKDLEKAGRKEADRKKASQYILPLFTLLARIRYDTVVLAINRFAKNMLSDIHDIIGEKSFKTEAVEQEVKKLLVGLEEFTS
jgi:hypothetical protein